MSRTRYINQESVHPVPGTGGDAGGAFRAVLVDFDTFWEHGRFRNYLGENLPSNGDPVGGEQAEYRPTGTGAGETGVEGGDGGLAPGPRVPGLREAVLACHDEMRRAGGLVEYIACVDAGGTIHGTMTAFIDPAYRSRGRENVGCFGLVTAGSAAVLRAMVDLARSRLRAAGAVAMRGPVNAPRHLLGYGVLWSGFDLPPLAGTPFNDPRLARAFDELHREGVFLEGFDPYYNLLEDNAKTREFIARLEARSGRRLDDVPLRLVHPDPSDPAGLERLCAAVDLAIHRALGDRPDITMGGPGRLAAMARAMSAAVEGGERLAGIFIVDGDVESRDENGNGCDPRGGDGGDGGGKKGDGMLDVGALVVALPDWFQAMRGERVTRLAADVYVVDPRFWGGHLFLLLSEHVNRVARDLGSARVEHTCVHGSTAAIMSTVRNGYCRVARECRVFEVAMEG